MNIFIEKAKHTLVKHAKNIFSLRNTHANHDKRAHLYGTNATYHVKGGLCLRFACNAWCQ